MQKLRRQTIRLTRDEIAKKGHSLYQRRIRRELAKEKIGRHVAIDVKSADFEVADSALVAAQSLRARPLGPKYGWSGWGIELRCVLAPLEGLLRVDGMGGGN